jgi:hypothetical protein
MVGPRAIIPAANDIRFVNRDDEGKLAGLFVAYTYTPTMFGGHRKWFVCPRCRRPACILYGVNSLRCRRCRGLKYASQSEASHWRVQRKALGIRSRVSASGVTLDGPFPPKPPKMRWATYKTGCERSMQLDSSNGSSALPETSVGSTVG